MKLIVKKLSPYKGILVFVFILVFAQALSNLLLPTLMGSIVDNGVVKGDIPYIWKIGGVMLGVSLLTRTTNDITQIQRVVMMMLRMVITAPLMMAGGIVMAVSKDAKLALVVLGVLPFLVLAVFLVLKYAMPLFKAVQNKLDRLNL